MAPSFTEKTRKIIKKIPKGKVTTYGQIAALAGNPKASRMIAGILHRYSEKDNLPWYRVVNSQGKISLKPGDGFEVQKSLLVNENIKFDENETIDLNRYQWQPRKIF